MPRWIPPTHHHEVPDAAGAVFRTTSGRLVDIIDLRPDDIDPRDIAHSLARTCRYGGHLGALPAPVPCDFWSVGHHLLLCALAAHHAYGWLTSMQEDADPEGKLYALIESLSLPRLVRWAALHDGHEAYTGDIVGPFKGWIDGHTEGRIGDLERQIDDAISEALQLFPACEEVDMVCDLDRFVLRLEMRELRADFTATLPDLAYAKASLNAAVQVDEVGQAISAAAVLGVLEVGRAIVPIAALGFNDTAIGWLRVLQSGEAGAW